MKKPHVRIILFFIERGPGVTNVMSGLSRALKELDAEVSIYEQSADSVANSPITRQTMHDINIEDVDLVITIGQDQTSIAFEEFKDRRYPPPVVFAAVEKDFAAKMCKEAPFMTGISIDNTSAFTPLKMIFRLQPDATKYLVPYHIDARFGRMAHDVAELGRYLQDRRVETIPFKLDNNPDYKALEQAIKGADLVMIPESAVTNKDAEKIEKMCGTLGVPFFGDNQAAQKSGGVYGLKEDFMFIGAKVAEFVEKIGLHRADPRDLEPYVLRDSRKFGIDEQKMAQCGVVLTDEMIASLDGSFGDFRDVGTRPIGYSMPTLDLLGHSLSYAVSHRIQVYLDANYLLQSFHDIVSDKEASDQQIRRLLQQKYKHVAFMGDWHAHHVWRLAQAESLPFPRSCTIVSTSDQLGPHGWAKQLEKTTVIDRICLPALDPLAPFNLLREAVPNLKKLLLIHHVHNDSTPGYLNDRIKKLKAASNEHGIELHIAASEDPSDLFDDIDDGAFDDCDGCLFYQDSLTGRSAGMIANSIVSRGIPVCAGGVSLGQITPIGYGVNLLKLGEYVFDTIHQRHEHPGEPPIIITLDQNDIYAICINHPMAVKMKMKASPLLPTLNLYRCVDVMSERNIAACVHGKASPVV